MSTAQGPQRGFLLAVGVIGIVIGLLIALELAIPLQPPLQQQVQSSSTSLTNAVYVDMPIGVGSNIKLNYEPANITVIIGVNNTVVWRNLDTAIHTVTATDKSFDSGDMKQGQEFVYTFTKPGVYDYYCIYHSWMRGTVVVKQGTQVVKVLMPPGVGSSTKLNYEPANITVVIGVNNTVMWINQDTAIHTVTSVTKVFDSGDMKQGQSFTYTFTQPGVYDYYCVYHSWMRGTVIVKQG